MKIPTVTSVIVGLSLSLAALSVGYFMFYQPNMQEKQWHDEYAQQLQEEINKKPRAEERVATVLREFVDAKNEWAAIAARKTPPANIAQGGISLAVNRWQLVLDARKYRNALQSALNRQVRTGGVTVVTGPQVPMFSENATDIVERDFQYPAQPYPVLVLDLGAVTVKGTMQQIMRNFESWPSLPNYLVVSDGLRISGTSPNLTGTYAVSLVGFVRGDVSGVVPEGAGTPGAVSNAPGAGPGPGGPGPLGTGAPGPGPSALGNPDGMEGR
jgi:hypothetical protein